jgi:hypothetical protein
MSIFLIKGDLYYNVLCLWHKLCGLCNSMLDI